MKIGILGGSGLYDLEGMEKVDTLDITTPFGKPSDPYSHGRIGGVDVFFMPRHGKGHRILPAEINHRANIYGFKTLGVDRILSISAVGSLKEELRPRDIILPDQYFDRTKKSIEHTFFGNGIVAHVGFGEPTCPELRNIAAKVASEVVAKGQDKDIRVKTGGTYVNMEGPLFSTKAESHVYRKMGFDVIGMTSLGEAKLCREAEICYQTVAMITDYDCWHETESTVTVEMIVECLIKNTKFAHELLRHLLPRIPAKQSCACGSALKNAIVTSKDVIPQATREALAPIISKYV